MKPRTAFIAGCFITGGIGVLMVAFCGWHLVSLFPSADLAGPFRQQATNFFIFSSFVFSVAFYVTGFVVGIYVVWFVVHTAVTSLLKTSSTRNR
jgi:hypothetical protein